MARLDEVLRLPCGAVLPGRVAKAATSEALATSHRLPTRRHAALYARWARGGAAWLVTGNVLVDPDHPIAAGDVALGAVLGPFRRWSDAVHEAGGRVWMQLNHPGRQAPRRLVPAPVGPSEVPVRRGRGVAFGRPRALADAEILALSERFADAAARAREAGFDGVQLHAAHGYLLSQFLSPLANVRDDRWGGDAVRRRALLLHVVGAVRAAVGPAFPIGVKLNAADFLAGGLDEAEALAVAEVLEGAGVDLLEVSGGTYETDTVLARDGRGERRHAFFQGFAEAARGRLVVPLVLTGGVRSRAAAAALVDGTAAAVGLARGAILDPELPGAWIRGEERPVPATPRFSGPAGGLAELAWYTARIGELADGRTPDAAGSRWRALADGLRRLA